MKKYVSGKCVIYSSSSYRRRAIKVLSKYMNDLLPLLNKNSQMDIEIIGE